MRLFFIGWSGKETGSAEAVKKMKDQGHEILYWSCSESQLGLKKSEFPGTIFHEFSNALSGVPPKEFRQEHIPPVGQDIIEQFYETESVVLTMMNKRYDYLSVSERKHLYYHLLSYWHWVAEKLRPEAIIFSNSPHAVYDFVLYSIAQRRKIKTIIFDNTNSIVDRIQVFNDFKFGSSVLVKEIKARQNETLAAADLSADLRDYYIMQSDTLRHTRPLYLKKSLSQYSGFKFIFLKFGAVWNSLKRRTFLKKSIQFLFSQLGNNPLKEYRNNQSPADFQEKFVYTPLNYQPERTTSPEGGIFVDQLQMIEILSAALPPGWLLYVKEHPMQWTVRGPHFFSYRYSGYYQHIARLNNVRLVPVDTDSYSLLEHSRAVAVVTGTVGLEAVLRGKPAIVFGYPWYQPCPAIFKVKDLLSCKQALDKIAAGAAVDEQEVLHYLAGFDKATFHGYIDEYGKGISRVSMEENVQAIVRAISFGLEKPL